MNNTTAVACFWIVVNEDETKGLENNKKFRKYSLTKDIRRLDRFYDKDSAEWVAADAEEILKEKFHVKECLYKETIEFLEEEIQIDEMLACEE